MKVLRRHQDTDIWRPFCKRRCIHKEPFVHTLVYYQTYNGSVDAANMGDSEKVLLVTSELNAMRRLDPDNIPAFGDDWEYRGKMYAAP